MKTKKKAAKKAVKKVAPKATAEDKAKPLKLWSVDELLSLPLEEDEPLEVQVISLANNPRYVYASLNGEKIAVSVPAWMAQNLLKKTINVQKQLNAENYEIVLNGN
jgi:hypothetical protein